MFLIKVNNFKSHIKGVVVSEPQDSDKISRNLTKVILSVGYEKRLAQWIQLIANQ